MDIHSIGGPITISEAAQLALNYRNNNPNQPIAHLFGKDIINEILEQNECKYLRINYGNTDEGKKELVLVGVDTNGDDLINGIIADHSRPCPTFCSASNPLNN